MGLQTGGQTDRQGESNIPPINFVCRGIPGNYILFLVSLHPLFHV